MAQPTTHLQPPQAADEASADQLLTMATHALRSRRLAEVDELRLAIEWAVHHGHPRNRRDPMVTPGGDSTPSLREHAIPELAMARENHPATTRALIADALDLAHRLPRTWAIVQAGECEPWVARKVAVITRALPSDQVDRVDRAVAKAIRGHAPSTVLEIARAKVIEADPETHRAERERSRHQRYVRLARTDEHGYRHVIAKVTAGDAAWIDAMLDRVADILATTMGHDHNHDELRSLAMGWLARPADLLKLLLEDTEDVKDHVWTQTGGDYFPFAPRTATRDHVDFDHAIPYDDTGPPGQTGPHNSGPLRRRHHRARTRGGYTARVAGPGRYLWRTPYGLAFLVDHTGTTRLTREQADTIAGAPEGVEIYFSTVAVDYPPA